MNYFEERIPKYFARYPIGLLMGMVIWLASCGSTNETVTPSGPQQLEFPNCELSRVENTISSGAVQSYQYTYENNRLVQADFYTQNEFNSRKTFIYDNQGNLAYMLGQNDTLSNVQDTIVAYEFKDGLLSKDTHYNPTNKEILTVTEYTYENGFLKTIEVINNEAGEDKPVAYQVESDERGNPIKVVLSAVNGAPPPITLETFYEYDDQFNPYYQFPDFIGISYFTQNNIVKTTQVLNGQTSVEQNNLTYHSHGFLQRRRSPTGQGEFVSAFTYQCQ